MMKVLWYVNIVMPEAARALGKGGVNAGGWLTGAMEALRNTGTELSILTVSGLVQESKRICVDGINYLLIPSKDFEARFEQILQKENMDLVHIFGTEYEYNTKLIHMCADRKIPHVVSLQGIMYQYAKHYDDGLPEKFRKINVLRKWMRKLYYADSIALEKARFEEQGAREIAALQQAWAVIGRTAWDRQSALSVNPKLEYYHVNENLRDAFYEGDGWSREGCQRHTLFVSQSAYPIKGFHMLLEAMPELIQRYPDLQVVVGGQKPYTLNNTLLDLGVDYFFEYQCYIKQLIRKYNLRDRIHYTGSLNAEAMKEQFLRCNVFLSCSSIENSPNSVGEAMLLGVPIVASNVGGTETMLTDGKDGILYDFFDRQAMIDGISRLFEQEDLALHMSANARKHAFITHDREKNTEDLLRVYCRIKERNV